MVQLGTERKAADESLRRSQAQLRNFVRHAPISIAMFDRDMCYLVTSGRWVAEHGRGHSDLVGLSHYQVLPDLPAEWKLVHQQGLAGATVKRGDKTPTAVRRILVVDDNPDVVESLALLLRVSGYEVDTAHDGLEAVESAARARPDLVFLDIGMPGMDGYVACRSMRAQPWGKDLAIFAMTGWGQEEDHRKTREAGFSGHLVKPVDQAALQRLLADPGPTQG